MEQVETKRECCTDRCCSGLVTGAVILALGVLLLLGNFHLFEVREILRFWPLALIAVGVQMLWRTVQGRAPRR